MIEWLFDGVVTFMYWLLLIGVLVVVHEAGHMAAAKLFRVGVPVFSVGMGPRMFGFVWRGTDYRVSALPLGGYVQMSGADPFGEEDTSAVVDPEEDFMRKPVWQRLIIMVAGPAVNLVLPFFVFTVLLMLGRPEISSFICSVYPDSVAAEAGLRDDDKIIAIDGVPTKLWHDVESLSRRHIEDGEGDLTLTVDRDGSPVEIEIGQEALGLTAHGQADFTSLGIAVDFSDGFRRPFTLGTRVGIESEDSPAGRSGLRPGDAIRDVDGVVVEDWRELVAALSGQRHLLRLERYELVDDKETKVERYVTLSLDGGSYTSPMPVYDNPWGILPLTLFAGEVLEGRPASKADIRPGDRFATVDGHLIRSFDHVVERVARSYDGSSTARPLDLQLVRDGELIEVKGLVPEFHVQKHEQYARPIIGVASRGGIARSLSVDRKYYGLVEAAFRAAEDTLDVMQRTGSVLYKVFTGQLKARDQLGGPIAMLDMVDQFADEGMFAFAELVGMISVSLGVMNLLPIPVLDGGQIMFYAIEGIRGRPLPLEVRERLQMAGVVLLMIVMLLVTANDINRAITRLLGA